MPVARHQVVRYQSGKRQVPKAHSPTSEPRVPGCWHSHERPEYLEQANLLTQEKESTSYRCLIPPANVAYCEGCLGDCYFAAVISVAPALRMMKIAALMMLAVAIVAVEAAPPGLPGLPGGGPGGSQCNTGCCNLGQTVFNGACADFVNAFKNDADTAISESDSAFQARVNRAPRPSGSCCVNARAYTQYGCSCNGDLMNAAASKGYSSNQVRIVGRATRFSVCANSDNGGPISSSC